MKKLFLLIYMLAMITALQAQDAKLRVAVFDPTSSGTNIDEGTKVAVRELISSTFVNTGKYNIVERSLLQQVMREQAFSNTDVVDESQATELGRLAGANKIVLSVVTLVGGRNMLSIKTIDVKTATVDQQKTRIVSSNDLLDIVETLTLELLGEKASKPVVDATPQTQTQTQTQTQSQSPARPRTPFLPKIGGKEKVDTKAATNTREETERNQQIALTATNSYTMAGSVSDLIVEAIEKQDPKNATANKYKLTDEERLGRLKKRDDIAKYIHSMTSDIGGYPAEEENVITFFCKKEPGNEIALLFFLDGTCIGMGSKNKGLLTKIPDDQEAGIHRISIWNHEKELYSTPVDFANKSYYAFEWSKSGISSAKENKDADSDNSYNSFDLSAAISDFIKSVIEQQNKKSDKLTTDEARFSNLKNNDDIAKYVISMTNSVENTPQNNAENLVFYMKKTTGNELAVLLFIDGQCVGAGTKNKGLIAQMPRQKFMGMHTLSLWSNEKELLNTPINFDFKSSYLFEWNKNTVVLSNL